MNLLSPLLSLARRFKAHQEKTSAISIALVCKKSFYGRVGSRIYAYLTDGLVKPRDLAMIGRAECAGKAIPV